MLKDRVKRKILSQVRNFFLEQNRNVGETFLRMEMTSTLTVPSNRKKNFLHGKSAFVGTPSAQKDFTQMCRPRLFGRVDLLALMNFAILKRITHCTGKKQLAFNRREFLLSYWNRENDKRSQFLLRHRSRWLHCLALAQALLAVTGVSNNRCCVSGEAGVHRESHAGAVVDHEIVRIRLGFRGRRI